MRSIFSYEVCYGSVVDDQLIGRNKSAGNARNQTLRENTKKRSS